MNKGAIFAIVLLLVGCTSVLQAPTAKSGQMPKDGELAFPSNYKSFPVFLSGI